jgi:hypothetical protein
MVDLNLHVRHSRAFLAAASISSARVELPLSSMGYKVGGMRFGILFELSLA